MTNRCSGRFRRVRGARVRSDPSWALVTKTPAGRPKLRKIRGCHGVYKYAPRAFEPGGSLAIRIFEGKRPAKVGDVRISEELVDRVWSDFQPYFNATTVDESYQPPPLLPSDTESPVKPITPSQ